MDITYFSDEIAAELNNRLLDNDQNTCVCISDEIEAASDTLLRGHGTQVLDEAVVATVCGSIEKVNKLVTVNPAHARYVPEVGDVVIGRVIEVSGKRWRIDLQSRQEAHLLLSAVNLPGSEQRRRTAEDELSMRALLKEGDLISAEIQAIHSDGTVMLHTRSSKYGKLGEGYVVAVPAELIRRQRRHFCSLSDIGIEIILGCNGLVWIDYNEDKFSEELPVEREMSSADCLARVNQAVQVLSRLQLRIQPDSLTIVVTDSLACCKSIKEMLAPAFLSHTAAKFLVSG